MGIRVALGAEPSSLVRLVLARAAWLTAVRLGRSASCWRCSRRAPSRGMLFGVTAADPGVLGRRSP